MSSSGTVAAIDIGTNSVLLLVARVVGPGRIEAVEERATITRLGEGVDRSRSLAPSAVERTLECLTEYRRVLDAFGVERVAAVGTSAMRDAAGGESFRARAGSILRSEPRVISGTEEARLTFEGGLSGIEALEHAGAEVLVFDIGGGSTELIRGRRGDADPPQAISLDVGSVRLTERHVTEDPPSGRDVAAIEDDVARALELAPPLRGCPLVGVAGTVTTLAAIAAELDPYDGARIHGSRLSLAALDAVTNRLLSMPQAARVKLPGLSPKRADVICAGALLCRAIVRRAETAELWVSDRGVRWGLALRLSSGDPA